MKPDSIKRDELHTLRTQQTNSAFSSGSDANRVKEKQMPRNVEIKARIDDIKTLTAKVAGIADKGPIEIFQDDTFFACPKGRMKLRTFSDTKAELIFYKRPNQAGPKTSEYYRAPVTTPDLMREVLSQGYGQAGRVCKHRTLYLIGKTRVHLDRVEGLGDFMELEVVLADNESTESGVKVANELLRKLGIPPDHLIEGAYVDLLDKGVD
jgi:predicted adenylyl cyclase CyaB